MLTRETQALEPNSMSIGLSSMDVGLGIRQSTSDEAGQGFGVQALPCPRLPLGCLGFSHHDAGRGLGVLVQRLGGSAWLPALQVHDPGSVGFSAPSPLDSCKNPGPSALASRPASHMTCGVPRLRDRAMSC